MAGIPSDVDVIREGIRVALEDVHTCMPGVVATFNPATQTANVAPVLKRPIKKADGTLTHETIPILHNIPIIFPRGGGTAIQWPLLPGDGLVLFFSEAATAQWRSTGQLSEPGDLRRHDLSYAFAIPGVAPMSNPLVPPVGPEVLITPSTWVRVGGLSAQFVADSTLVATNLARLFADITALKAAVAAGFSAPVFASAATAFSAASATTPTAPTTTACSTLKAD